MKSLVVAIVFCLGLSVSAFARDVKAPEGSAAWSAFDTYVDEQGNISNPKDVIETWVHLGTVAIHEEKSIADLHSTYAPRWAVDYFKANGNFPDGAMLVKEVRHARGSTLTTGSAYWADDVVVWFVMVKDAKNRFPDNPLWGEGWGWALFNGDDHDKQVAQSYTDECLGCHVPVKDNDWIYTYTYYPLFGESVRKLAPPAEEMKVAEAPASNAAAPSEEDIKRGEKIFNRCKSCHTIEAGKNKTGPSLAGVFGRKAGTAEGFNGSDAMRASAVVWNEQTLDEFLADVIHFIPGNRMAKVFPAGVKKMEDRKALIQFLKHAR